MTKYTEESDGSIRFTFSQHSGRVAVVVVSIIFLLVGIPFLIASGFNIAAEMEREAFRLFNMSSLTAALLLFGIMFSLLPLFLIIQSVNKKNKQMIPASFDFDNKHREFIITEQNGETFKIPYSFIVKFDLRYYVVSNKKSSTTYYVLYILKKDEAFIDLYQSTRKKDIEKILADVKIKINLAAGEMDPKKHEQPSLPEKILCDEQSDKVVFRWENKPNIVGMIMAFIFLFLFFYFFIQISRNELVPLIIVSLMAAIFGLVMIFGIIKAVNDALTYKTIYLSKDYFSYGFLSKKQLEFEEKNKFSVNTIRKIQYFYDFETEVFAQEKNLLVVQEGGQSLQEKKMERNYNIAEILNSLIKGNASILSMPISGLRLIDILRFEKVLESRINNYGGQVI